MTRSRLLLAFLVAMLGMAPSLEHARAADGLVTGAHVRLTQHDVQLRERPGTLSSGIQAIPKGEIVRLLSGPRACDLAEGCTTDWYKAKYRSWKGFLPEDALAYTGLAGERIARRYHRVTVVSLARQQFEVYEGGQLRLVSATTTGRPSLATPTGTFRVIAKYSPYVFRSPDEVTSTGWYPDSPVEYAVKYERSGYYIHDAPWRPDGGYGKGTNEWHVDPDGQPRQGSHGCTNLPAWAAEWYFHWVRIGDVVRVVKG